MDSRDKDNSSIFNLCALGLSPEVFRFQAALLSSTKAV